MKPSQANAFERAAAQKKISNLQTRVKVAQDALKAVEAAMPHVEKKPLQGTPLTIETLPEGQKVKLNLSRIYASPDFASRTAHYRKFVQESGDKIFTVQHDPRFGNESSLVCLAEDPAEIKWLWHISDLEVVA